MYLQSHDLSDPHGTNVIGVAIAWIEDTLLGTTATTIAVLAVAGVGLAMLRGRIDARRGIAIVLGCVLLFSARTIATSLTPPAPLSAVPEKFSGSAASSPPPAPRAPQSDLYTSASVPEAQP